MKLIGFANNNKSSGKDSLLTIIAHKISLDSKVLVINNTKNKDLDKYFLVETKYKIDNLKPFIEANNVTSELILELLEKITNNLYYLSSENSTLETDELLIVKDYLNEFFDYILIDNVLSTTNIYESIIELRLPTEDKRKNIEDNAISVVNFWSDFYTMKKNNEDLYLPFEPDVVNFISGVQLKFPDVFEKDLLKILEVVTKKPINEEKEKAKGFSFRSIFNK